jgi:hypothetical protein
MTALDDKLKPKIYNIINAKGIDATFKVNLINPDDYDPETGHTTPDIPTDTTVKVSPPENYREEIIDHHAIQRGDVKCMLPSYGLSFTPDVGMRVEMVGYTWKIITVEPLYTGAEIGAWTLQLRK